MQTKIVPLVNNHNFYNKEVLLAVSKQVEGKAHQLAKCQQVTQIKAIQH